MGALIGVALALAICAGAAALGAGRERSFYPVMVMVVASYYVLFALIAGAMPALYAELLVLAAFVAIAVAGYKTSSWLVVAALALHGVLDLVHGHVIENPGVPPWWPPFCLAFDGAMAAWLAWQMLRRGRARAPA